MCSIGQSLGCFPGWEIIHYRHGIFELIFLGGDYFCPRNDPTCHQYSGFNQVGWNHSNTFKYIRIPGLKVQWWMNIQHSSESWPPGRPNHASHRALVFCCQVSRTRIAKVLMFLAASALTLFFSFFDGDIVGWYWGKPLWSRLGLVLGKSQPEATLGLPAALPFNEFCKFWKLQGLSIIISLIFTPTTYVAGVNRHAYDPTLYGRSQVVKS